jgi:hypothetical protein
MKMRLQSAEYLSEHGGRLPAGAVLDVDDATAMRWRAMGIARKASNSAKTYREERLEKMVQMREEDEMNEDEGVYNARLTRGHTEPEMDDDADEMPAPEDEKADGEHGQGAVRPTADARKRDAKK